MTAVQELLGHSSIVMTMRYAHLAPEAIRQTVQLLDGLGKEWAERPEKKKKKKKKKKKIVYVLYSDVAGLRGSKAESGLISCGVEQNAPRGSVRRPARDVGTPPTLPSLTGLAAPALEREDSAFAHPVESTTSSSDSEGGGSRVLAS
jgi:hypothetical protein